MEKMMGFLEKYLMPISGKMSANKYLRAISGGFIAIMSANIIGSMFTLIGNLPIPAYTNWLAETGLNAVLALPGTVTVSMISLYAAFFIAYTLAREFQSDGAGAGLISLISFFIITNVGRYFVAAEEGAAAVTAVSTEFLAAKGLFAAMIIALITGRAYVWILDKGWTIKLPDSVPPNVTNSFKTLIPGFIIVTFWLIIGTLCTKTSYGGLHQMIFGVIQSNLMRFMGNNIGAWAFFNIMTGLLWFFGLHGGNIVGSITNPIYTPLSLENLEVYMADPTAKMPNIISGAFGKTFCFGGVASMMGLAILMVFFAKSEQMKTLGKLALPTTIFFINEPLLFGIPTVLNPLFFFPMLFLTTIQGILTYFMMKIGIVPIPHGVQVPWTTPGIIHGFLQGGIGLAIWEALMIVLSIVLWYPFFKIQDNISLKQEQGE